MVLKRRQFGFQLLRIMRGIDGRYGMDKGAEWADDSDNGLGEEWEDEDRLIEDENEAALEALLNDEGWASDTDSNCSEYMEQHSVSRRPWAAQKDV